MQTAARLTALMDHLGVKVAHFATQMPGDVVGLVQAHPERIAGLVLCVPTRLDPAPLVDVAARLLMIAGEKGLTSETTGRALERLPAAKRFVLADYDAAGWSDVVADRTGDVVGYMRAFLAGSPDAELRNVNSLAVTEQTGVHAGLSYRITGRGPALVLMPFFLAPSQWAPARAELARTFTVIELGGPHIGGVAALEDRARAPTYLAMFRTLVEWLALHPGDRILDVGCGSGALDRVLARQLGADARIDAVDLNPFFLTEAGARERCGARRTHSVRARQRVGAAVRGSHIQ